MGPTKPDHNERLIAYTVITLSSFHCNSKLKMRKNKNPCFYLSLIDFTERRIEGTSKCVLCSGTVLKNWRFKSFIDFEKLYLHTWLYTSFYLCLVCLSLME